MNLSDSYVPELRVPVRKVAVEVLTKQGRETAVLFLAPGCSPEDIFEEPTHFFPADAGGSIRIYARSAVIAVVVDASDEPPESLAVLGVAYLVRTVSVYLLGGEVITGTLKSLTGLRRTLDLVNQPAKSFALHVDGKIHHIAKRHVERIEERS